GGQQCHPRPRAGPPFLEKKRAEGKTPKRTPAPPKRAGQRPLLRPPPGRRPPGCHSQGYGPGRAPGERLCRQRGRLTPRTPALRPSHSRTPHHPTTWASGSPTEDHLPLHENDHQNHLTQRGVRSGRRTDSVLIAVVSFLPPAAHGALSRMPARAERPQAFRNASAV